MLRSRRAVVRTGEIIVSLSLLIVVQVRKWVMENIRTMVSSMRSRDVRDINQQTGSPIEWMSVDQSPLAYFPLCITKHVNGFLFSTQYFCQHQLMSGSDEQVEVVSAMFCQVAFSVFSLDRRFCH